MPQPHAAGSCQDARPDPVLAVGKTAPFSRIAAARFSPPGYSQIMPVAAGDDAVRSTTRVLFLKPATGLPGQNVVRDLVYGCWCNGRRIGGMQMPPLNELYVATHVRQPGVEVSLLDAQLEPARFKTIRRSRFDGVDLVVILSSTQTFKQDVRVLREMKDARPDLVSILFGAHPTFMARFCLQEDAVDYVVLREPEETMRCLVGALHRRAAVEDLPGIGYRAADGSVRINPDRPFMNMDDLPIPDRTLLPPGVDHFNPVVRRLPYTTMQTSRGCPGRCIFCTAPVFYGRKYRFRSTQKLLEELRHLKHLGYREVFIRDETFTAFKNRNREICEAMIAENLGLSWIANGRVDMIDRETMALMKRAGCHLLKFGVETGSDDILARYKKGTTTAQAVHVFEMARQVGLETHAHMVLGGPGETRDTVERSIAFAKRLKPTTVSFGILTPYPGTELFNMVAEKHPEIQDGSDSTLKNLHTEGFFSESVCGLRGAFLSRMITHAYRRFYFRPTYLARRLLSIRSFEEVMILAIAGLNVFRFSLTGRK